MSAVDRVLDGLARGGAGRVLRGVADAFLGGRPRVVRVAAGPLRGGRLELDLRLEKAYWLGRYERELQALVAGSLGPGSVLYDVGAHIGFFSVGAARLGAKVYAFEPRPRNAARIRRNAELNGLDIEVVEAAAWSVDGTVGFAAGPSESEGRVEGAGETRAVSLDSFAAAHRPPTFLKVDVEGGEGAVLRGAERILRDEMPLIVCEVHGPESRAEVRSLLGGYRLSEVGSEWRILARPARDVG